jgi:hypothetical protein
MTVSQLPFLPRKSGNRLLDALSAGDLVGIVDDVAIVQIHAHESSQTRGRSMRFVDFPIDAVLSVLVTLDGRSVEVASTGNEGFVDADAALESTSSPRSTVCQVSGRVGRMHFETFQGRLGSETFARLMRRNVSASLFSTQQFLACNAKHAVLARCARWLMMTADRAGRSEFSLSREFLAIMLGVPVGALREVIELLENFGAVHYRQASLTIVDAGILESHACECYSACKSAFAQSLVS